MTQKLLKRLTRQPTSHAVPTPANPSLPTRSKKYGVGKEIGGAVYVHRRYEHLLGEPVLAAKKHLPEEFDYTVVKYTERKGTVSFIGSPDFDTAPEPTVGESILVRPDGRTTRRAALSDPYIYHHKWLFVADDYPGFDVEAARRRSFAWLRLPNIDSRRIGRRSYWQQHVLPRLEDVEEPRQETENGRST